ncbi:MAG: HD domain-containing phosphohydrolase [Thermoanaerobaculales bacterium]|jgi:HD-GYP domain-containing protein (c-di-GMP phosphodiesterase class II)|nr:HD domain-containing phosphohydrolase [Thermoanaerobaculales bacterium]
MGLLTRIQSSLTYPIAATLVLVTVVPVALAGWLFASYNREHLTTVEKLYLNRQAVSLAGDVDHFVTSRSTYLDSTARALAVSAKDDVVVLESFLEEMAGAAGPSYAYLQILDREGEGSYVYDPQLSTGEVELLSAVVRETRDRAMEGEPSPQHRLELASDRSPWAIMVYPLSSPGGAVWGSLAGVLDFEDFESGFADNSFSGLHVHVIDSDGTVTLSSDPSLRGSSLADAPLVRDFLTRPLALTSTYTNPLYPDVGEVLGSAAPVPSLGWGVIIERPTSVAFAPVKVMQQRTLVVSTIAGLLALGLGFAFSRRLIGPLQDLAHISSEISEGTFSVRAEVSGADEIAQLGNNFNHMAGNIESLVRKLKHALRQNQELFLETIRTLAAAIDAKDAYTKGHSERVSAYSMAIARHLGLNFDDVFHVRIAAILHDVGKLGIKDGILNKPGGLTDEEYEIMRRHPAIGAQIMAPISKLKSIIPGIRNHHETWDGRGYPDKLQGEEIPMVARIVGVADTFDAMTTNRPYQKAMPLEYVVQKMEAMAGTRFDPEVITAFTAAVAAGDIMPPDALNGGAEATARTEES